MEEEQFMTLKITKNYLYPILILLIFILLIFSIFSCDLLPKMEDEYFIEKYDLSTSMISPVERSCIRDISPTFKWDISESAVSYDFQLSRNESFSGTLLADIKGITKKEYTYTGELTEHGEYYWRFRVLINNEWSAWLSYSFIYIPGDLFDSFEVNDGSFSTLHDWTFSEYSNPFIQSYESYQGNYAVQMGEQDDSSDSFFSVSVSNNKEKLISFWVKNNSSSSLVFKIDSEEKLSIQNVWNWSKYTVYLEAGTHSLTWNFDKWSYSDPAYIDTITISDIQDFSEAFDTFDQSFISSKPIQRDGDSFPFLQTEEIYEGDSSIQFGDIGSYENSSFETTIKIESDCKVSFYAKKSSYYGILKFSIDDSVKFDSSSSISDWTEHIYFLTKGTYTLKWDYYKKYSYDSNDEKVYINSITISELPVFSEAFTTLDQSFISSKPIERKGDALPFIQTLEKYEGDNSIHFGDIGINEESSFETTITIESDCNVSFLVKKIYSYEKFKFCINDSYKINSSSTISNWTEHSFFLPKGTNTLKWSLSKSYSTSYSGRTWIDSIEILQIPDISEAFTTLDQSFITSQSIIRDGEKAPFIQSEEKYEGDSSIQFGDVGRSGESIFETTFTLSKSFKLSFFAKKDSGGGYLYFYINTSQKETEYSISRWKKYEYNLPSGTHTLKWRHSKYNDDESEKCWIDSIVLTEL